MARGLFLTWCLVMIAGAAHADAAIRALDVRALDVSALAFQLDATRVVLGDTASIDVTLTARTVDGQPLDVAPPRLAVSTGTVSAPVRTAPGTWRATFTPPTERFPHVAILFGVIDTATTSAVGFIPLRLWGRGQTAVKTKPGSQVTVFIGNESFGPVAANDDGLASVPIIVPPGPEHAVAKSVDALGNESQKTIDLGVPSFNRLAMIALDDVAAADGTGAARLLAFAVDRKGEPLFEASFTTKASVGTAQKAEGVSPGMFRIVYQPGLAAKGKAHVEVALDGAPGSSAATDVQLLSGRPARATIESRVSAVSADDARELQVDVRLFDQANNSVPAQAGSLDVDGGRIERIEELPGAGRRVIWILPERAPVDAGAAQVTLTARSVKGDVLGRKAITLLPGKPARASFDAVAPVVGDGASAVEVQLRVVDRLGNALVPTGASVSVDSALGQIVGATVDARAEGGPVYRARFVPEPTDRALAATLSGSVGGLNANTRVEIAPRPRARLLVGPGVIVNAVNNNAGVLGVGPELSLLVRVPFEETVHVGVDVALYQSVLGDHVDRRDFPVLLEGAWRPLLTPDLCLHLGGGAGIALSDVNVATTSASGRRSVEPSLAAQGVAGIAYRLGPGFIEADLRAGYSFNLASLQGSDSGPPVGVGVVLGYRFGI